METDKAGEELYEAVDALVYAAARKAGDLDVERLEKLLDKLPALIRLLDMLDEKTVESLETLLKLATSIGEALKGSEECISKALEEPAEPVRGLRGLLGLLRDEEVMKGLGKAVQLLKALGRCS